MDASMADHVFALDWREQQTPSLVMTMTMTMTTGAGAGAEMMQAPAGSLSSTVAGQAHLRAKLKQLILLCKDHVPLAPPMVVLGPRSRRVLSLAGTRGT